MRLASRDDLKRVRQIVEQFAEPWWSIVVYTCFDSVTGTLAVAPSLQHPIGAAAAKALLKDLDLPRGSVQHHRTQPGNKGAKTALISACDRAEQLRQILHSRGSFDERYESLRRLRAPQWGRTTCFDLLIRTGQLAVGGHHYQPELAYLAGSTGPKKGFHEVCGIEVTRANVDQCEDLLHGWTQRWDSVAALVGVHWSGAPYTPADFQNALCIFQERATGER